MAAGVGKTYAMLEEARACAAEGLDVVVGYAEPHIRTETEALLLGMEILPYKIVEYRGAKLKEFDLDAALAQAGARSASTSWPTPTRPGMRHQKRWQDVVELLDAGINVYTTLNVQHLESVNDIVERITGVKVRETLPDSVLEQADEVELVDIAPEELLERFREGKVYRPEQAERAAKHFFTKGNLIALRELALRTTAQRVDAQMQDFRREEAIAHGRARDGAHARLRRAPARCRRGWCARPSGWRRGCGRTGSRRTSRRPRRRACPSGDRQRVEQNLRLAEQLGRRPSRSAATTSPTRSSPTRRTHNVTKIVIGKPQRPRWRESCFGSVVDDLVRRSGEIDIYVIRGDAEGRTRVGPATRPRRRRLGPRATLAAVSSRPSATAVGWPLYHHAREHCRERKRPDAVPARRAVGRHAPQPRGGDPGVGARRGGVRLLLRPAVPDVRRRRPAVPRHVRCHAGRRRW